MNTRRHFKEPDYSVEEGERRGRYVFLRDQNGDMHAISANAVAAVCQADDGCVVLLPGGRIIVVPRSLQTVIEWLDQAPR